MRLWFDDLHLFIYLVVFDFVRAWMYVIIIIIIIIVDFHFRYDRERQSIKNIVLPIK